ncbi:MAG: ATPase [Clostridiales bacterium]|nr:ATPase [Clostridiales bacterium]
MKDAALGIEFGSTRIKAVMTDKSGKIVAEGSHTWENELIDEDGRKIWSYSLDAIRNGLQDCYRDLKNDYKSRFGETLTTVGAIGISAMMHGYMAFDSEGSLLVPFRTWRNTITEEAADKLTDAFGFNIPQRWSIAHFYQAILRNEPHIPSVTHFTTLAGFIHEKLTGEKVLGIGDASGMFPISGSDYDPVMIAKFNELTGKDLKALLPRVLSAGDNAGTLTSEGALFLDPEGDLVPGIPMCPPEGDAGTGMAATNSIAVRTGNVSAGTSVFAMIVMEKPLSKVHKEIDIVTTPDGSPVAMVHCNNCTSEINAWAGFLKGFADAVGADVDMGTIYTAFFSSALKGQPDCDGVIGFNYFSGEPVTGLSEGRPLLVRKPDSAMTFENFTRSQLMSAVATLKIGMDILGEENVAVDKMYGHGGFFKTPVAGQKIMAAALGAPVTVMETAGEGGPWGMSLLGLYLLAKSEDGFTGSLSDFLNGKIFADCKSSTSDADASDKEGFASYLASYKDALDIERIAVEKISL